MSLATFLLQNNSHLVAVAKFILLYVIVIAILVGVSIIYKKVKKQDVIRDADERGYSTHTHQSHAAVENQHYRRLHEQEEHHPHNEHVNVNRDPMQQLQYEHVQRLHNSNAVGVQNKLTPSHNTLCGIVSIDQTAVQRSNVLRLHSSYIPMLFISKNAKQLFRIKVGTSPITSDRIGNYSYPYAGETFSVPAWKQLPLIAATNKQPTNHNIEHVQFETIAYEGKKLVCVNMYYPDNSMVAAGLLECGLILPLSERQQFYTADRDIDIFGGKYENNNYIHTIILLNNITSHIRNKTTMSIGVSSISIKTSIQDEMTTALTNFSDLLFGESTDCFQLLNGRQTNNVVKDPLDNIQSTSHPILKSNNATLLSLSIAYNVKACPKYTQKHFREALQNSSLGRYMNLFSNLDNSNGLRQRYIQELEVTVFNVMLFDKHTATQLQFITNYYDWTNYELTSKHDNYIKTLTVQNSEIRNRREIAVEPYKQDNSDMSDAESIYGTTHYVDIEETASVSTIQSTADDDNSNNDNINNHGNDDGEYTDNNIEEIYDNPEVEESLRSLYE